MSMSDQGSDPRGFLAKLIAMLRGGGGGGGFSDDPRKQAMFASLPMPGSGFPGAPGGAPTDMSGAGPWGAGFPPAPTPTPRPEPPAAVPVPQQRPAQRLNRGQY
jgi:hypothetical protein